jgi:hypothetical protein
MSRLNAIAIWRGRRALKAAVTAIAPFVDHSRERLRDIPDSMWLDPYVVGFLGMLITLVAKQTSLNLGSMALAYVQARAWAEITGIEQELLGEEITMLDAAGNTSFRAGCENAMDFFKALTDQDWAQASLTEGGGRSTIVEEEVGFLLEEQAVRLRRLWSQYFDDAVTAA